jgi:hypothetical protein
MIRQQEAIRRANVYQTTKHRLANKHYKTKTTDVFNEVAARFGYEPRSVSNIYYAMRKEEEKKLGQIRASKKLGAEIARWFAVNITKWHELSLDSSSTSYIKKEFSVNEFPNYGEYSFEFLLESNYTVVKSGDGKNEPIITDVIINSYSLELTKVCNADDEEIILQQKYIQEIEDHLYSILKLSIDYHK